MARNYSLPSGTHLEVYSRAKSRNEGRYMGLMPMESISSNGPSRAHEITVRTAQQLDGCLRHRSVLARRQNDHEVAVRYTSRSRNHPQGETHVPASTDDSRRTSKQYSHSRTLRISRSRSERHRQICVLLRRRWIFL